MFGWDCDLRRVSKADVGMEEDAEERSNTEQKERGSDKEEKVISTKCCREVRWARPEKKEVTGFGQERVRECLFRGTAEVGTSL